jgi:hypothetical protein
MVYASNNTGANFTIADGTGVMYITSANTDETWVVTLPTGAVNGQILYIRYVEDGIDDCTIGGVSYTASANLTFVFVGGSWQLF